MTCPKCNNGIYIGSRLSEDAYIIVGHDRDSRPIYEHVKCPPHLYTRICKKCWNDFYTHDLTVHFCSYSCEDYYNNPREDY